MRRLAATSHRRTMPMHLFQIARYALLVIAFGAPAAWAQGQAADRAVERMLAAYRDWSASQRFSRSARSTILDRIASGIQFQAGSGRER